jgi:hypothetical protein
LIIVHGNVFRFTLRACLRDKINMEQRKVQKEIKQARDKALSDAKQRMDGLRRRRAEDEAQVSPSLLCRRAPKIEIILPSF